MRLCRVLLIRRTVSDVRPDDHERRAPRHGAGRRDYPVYLLQVVAVCHLKDVPAVRTEAVADVLGEGEIGRAFDGDAIRIVEDDELAHAKVPRQRAGLGRDALHHVAVAGDDVGMMIDDLEVAPVEPLSEHVLGDCQTDGVRYALPQRTRRHLNARRATALRMSGRVRPPLTELLDVVETYVIAGQVEQRVQQHRRVPSRQHEVVPVRPRGIARIVLQVFCPEQVG